MDREEKNKKINILLNKIMAENDLFALSELMELKTPDISIIAYNILKDKSYTEDIVNEVMIALIKNIHNFRDYKNINGWINSVTIHRSIDFLRKTKHEVALTQEYFTDINAYSENSIVERLTIVSALESLNPIEENIFVDKYVNDMTLFELSDKYYLSVKKVRNILKNAKIKFLHYYKKEDKA